MIEFSQAVAKLVREDPRYKPEAYLFVLESLGYAQRKLGMGQPVPREEEVASPASEGESAEEENDPEANRHLTGQQLCEAIRLYALEQFGYLAKTVLNNWGVHTTGDFGEIVFNLIRVKQMKKTKNDKRSDFEDIFDFEIGLSQSFKFTLSE